MSNRSTDLRNEPHPRRKPGKIVCRILLIFLIYVALGFFLPPLLPVQSETALPAFDGTAAGARVRCIDDNQEALLWRLRLIDAARESVVLSTYDFSDGESGKAVMAALLAASDRGVEVRILVDGMNGVLHLRGSPAFRALIARENVEAKFYNPINLLTPWKSNYHLHDKYLIADDLAFLVGGRNVDEPSLGSGAGRKNADRDVLVWFADDADPALLTQFRNYSDSVWELECSRAQSYRGQSKRVSAAEAELYERYRANGTNSFDAVDWRAATIAADGVSLLVNPVNAGNKAPELWSALRGIMEDGSDVAIVTPYIILDGDMYGDIASLAEKGGVRFYTNAVSNGANAFGCADYLNSKARILSTGAEVYEWQGDRSLHTKTVLVDDDLSVIGSFNMDMRSAYLDTELMLVVDCPELNAALRSQLADMAEQSLRNDPDGAVEYGDGYVTVPMSFGKRAFFAVLRIVIRPFRYLL